mgnify:CR=1 FL=1
MKRIINEMKLRLQAKSVNEGVSRAVISAFCAELNPTVEEIGDIRCAVSEAVTNCIVHAYKDKSERENCYIYISVRLYENREITVEISDRGCGIADLKEAMSPSFTTDREGERSGMGFTVMESFMDELSVVSASEEGTRVVLTKKLGGKK